MNGSNQSQGNSMHDSLDFMLPEKMNIPALPLSGTLVFPYALTPLVIDGESAIQLVTRVANGKTDRSVPGDPAAG